MTIQGRSSARSSSSTGCSCSTSAGAATLILVGYDGGMARARVEPGVPPGLVYETEFVTLVEESELLGRLDGLRFDPIVIRGQAAKRTARHFGLDYDYEARGRLMPGQPVPQWLDPLRARTAALAGVASDELVEALVQRYPAGSTIGW